MSPRAPSAALLRFAASWRGPSSAHSATFADPDGTLVGRASIRRNGDLQPTPPAGDKVAVAWATTAPFLTGLGLLGRARRR